MNRYLEAYLKATGETKDNYSPRAYMRWIGRKHAEFQKQESCTCRPGQQKYCEEFCKFLGV